MGRDEGHAILLTPDIGMIVRAEAEEIHVVMTPDAHLRNRPRRDETT